METENTNNLIVPVPNVVQAEPQQQIRNSSRVARYAANYLDLLIVGVIQIPFSLVLALFAFLSKNSLLISFVQTLYFLIFLIISCFYFTINDHQRGGTFGKKFFGLQVIDEETHANLSLGRSFVRNVLGRFIAMIFFYLGILWILWDKNRQGWHDKLAHARVIQVEPLKGQKKALAYILFVLGVLFPIIVAVGVLAILVLAAVNPQAQIDKAKKAAEQQQQILQQQQQNNGTSLYQIIPSQ